MPKWAYYNEHDPFATAWLRELIKDGLIAPGEVDERDIQDVTPDDLGPFRQCHFFAGIGVWSLAARRAGWGDDEAIWTGSCPCQPFSAAGKGGGFDDERHLWPAFHYHIEQCAPPVVVGEQVAGADGDAWLDLVSADLDATGYAFGAAETVAAGFGAPHKRTRNYWVAIELADAPDSDGRRGERGAKKGTRSRGERGRGLASCGPVGGLDDPLCDRRGARRDDHAEHDGDEPPASGDVSARGVADAHGRFAGIGDVQSGGEQRFEPKDGRPLWSGDSGSRAGPPSGLERPGPVNGLWRDADWLRCRDEKWRPVESGTFPLVDAGTFRNRVGLLRGAGNAVTLGQAQGFLEAVKSCRP